MDPLFTICAIVSAISLLCVGALGDESTFDVMNYGAKADGITDDSLAFLKAWNDTCNSNAGAPTMVVPRSKTFLVRPLTFSGPCKTSKVYVAIRGTIMAPNGPDQWKGLDISSWIVFSNIDGMQIVGTRWGSMDGKGKAWWDIHCRDHPGPGCVTLAPTALKFLGSKNVALKHIKIANSAQAHILLEGCQSVVLRGLRLNSPATSPNTDGVHISSSRRVLLRNSYISSGDDCVSIGDQTSDINITQSRCGPGHGISIGSLGRTGNATVHVEDIHVRFVKFIGTTNGARIKTWQTGKGDVRRIDFSHLTFLSVQNPIIIDQHYCDKLGACPDTKTGVQLTDITYYNMTGTSKTQVAINFNCPGNRSGHDQSDFRPAGKAGHRLLQPCFRRRQRQRRSPLLSRLKRLSVSCFAPMGVWSGRRPLAGRQMLMKCLVFPYSSMHIE